MLESFAYTVLSDFERLRYMCGFAGFGCTDGSLWDERYLWANLGRRMGARISHRGPDDRDVHVSPNSVLAHARLAVMDPVGGRQPMTEMVRDHEVTIAYNGEIYNFIELRDELKKLGHVFKTECDTEVVLKSYIQFGEDCVQKLNGIYAFVIDDTANDKLFFCRDRFGVKPLFYTFSNDRIVFASEIKGLFEYPGVNPTVDRNGLAEIFGLGPARTPGCGVFKGINELLPGHCAVFSKGSFIEKRYYAVAPYEMTDTYEQAVENVRYLICDIAKRQKIADVPICTFLSGGLDSAVITALVAQELKKDGRILDTYSFDYEDNDKYFTASSFQPTEDEPWAEKSSEYIGTKHTRLICSNDALYSCLFDAVIAKDLPGMADIDSSLVYFCRQVKKNHSVALCGECADEIFGGYPWFNNPDCSSFPWCRNMDYRKSILREDVAQFVDLDSYVQNQFRLTLTDTPVLAGESEQRIRERQMNWMNIKWFMQTLLDRKDRCSMYSGLEVRVPYADHRLLEYVYNAPWEYKCHDGVVKSLLRDAAKGFLPDDILYRKKSPYPKTHNPGYEALLKNKLKFILVDSLQPINKIIDSELVSKLLDADFDYGKPWFGQLMAGPQMIAYLIQINYWLIHYSIRLEL